MKLYDLPGCPFCKMVRERMDKLGLQYERIEVPPMRSMRKEVLEVSGQYTVPVLVDGEVVLDDENKILRYLDEKYAPR